MANNLHAKEIKSKKVTKQEYLILSNTVRRNTVYKVM